MNWSLDLATNAQWWWIFSSSAGLTWLRNFLKDSWYEIVCWKNSWHLKREEELECFVDRIIIMINSLFIDDNILTIAMIDNCLSHKIWLDLIHKLKRDIFWETVVEVDLPSMISIKEFQLKWNFINKKKLLFHII